MRALSWRLILAAAAAACGSGGDRASPSLLEQGRLYTSWLYGREYQKLWDRFSPDMRQTFGGVSDLAAFAGRSVARLGTEQGALGERVSDIAPFQVYQRTAAFGPTRRPMLIEWSLAQNGEVTGFVLRPVPSDLR